MSNISILAAKGAANKQNSLITNTNSTASTLSKLVAREKTDNQLAIEESEKNQGGFFGGIGYAFEKLGLGIMSSLEGIWDYTAGGLAKLFGADDWAEQQFSNDWLDYNHADDWFNPSDGWKVVGDVAGGIGTSVPAIAGVVAAGAITVASGGSLSPVAAGLISASIAGLGAAGNATKEAYRQTGELGGKEFGHGALVGTTEGLVEGLSAGIGVGTGQVVKGISKSFGKEIAESATRQTLGKTIVKGFVGEAFEEGLAEVLDPVWARITYDPNAKNATFQEIGYAALIGGLSGAIMGGADVSLRNVASTARGNTIASEGKAGNVMKMSEQLNLYEEENKTGQEAFELVQNVYSELKTSLEKTDGKISTIKQKMLLGVLEKANTTAIFSPIVTKSAVNIVNNAELIAQRLTSFGYTDSNGKPITFTAEQIRSGVDINNQKSFSKALKNNDVLRTLAVADATGQITMNTAKFKEATLLGQKLSSQVDLNRFIETATESELSAVGEKLGISDWQGITNAEFQEKITDFVKNDGVELYKKERLIVKDAENVSADSAKRLPKVLGVVAEGVTRYSLADSQIAVIKDGDNYRIYDYTSKRLSKVLTKQELSKAIKQLNNQTGQVAAEVKNQLEKESELKKQAEQIDSYARENISDYNKLNSANQSMIRAVIRQGRAAGIAEADILSYARVSAHTGLNMVFNKQLCLVGVNTETKQNIYSDGYFDPNNNRIVINPETKRTHEALLIHELDHAIRKTADGGTILEQGVKNMSKQEKESIIKRYREAGRGGSVELIEEINAHYSEGMLTNKNILKKLCENKPTLKQKMLNFFKKSSVDYSEDIKLSKQAKSLYNRYKKLFDEFSAHNTGNNAVETTTNNNSNSYALAKDEQNMYNNEKGAETYGEKTETNKETGVKQTNNSGNEVWSDSGRRGVSVFNDGGTIRQLSEIVKNEKTIEVIGNNFTEIYTKPKSETQENLAWHAKNEDINIYFAKPKGSHSNIYSYDGKNLIVNENLSEKALVDILNVEKPIKRIISSDKIAHISAERWNTFIQNFPEAYLTRIPIQQFLDMTTDSYVTQRQLNARSSQISKKVAATDIKNTSGEYMYLKIDLKNKVVTEHEGRHRMNALLNAGNAFADVFVIPVNDIGQESYGNIEVKGQFNSKKHNLGLVRANSQRFSSEINQVFKTDDGNIRYALPKTDSNDNILNDKQVEYFKESKVVDENGRLKVVYHGTTHIGFTEFKGRNAYYMSDNPLVAKGYNQHKRDIASLYKGYLNIKNPLQINANRQQWYNLLKTPINKQLNLTNKQLNMVYREAFGAYIPTKYTPADLTYLVTSINKLGFANYDGIIIKDIYDNLGQQQNELGNNYIFFNSNQFKNIDNINPTISEDIRYALDKSEDVKNLVAIHNTSESKLLKSIELGGLPMPSIAIIKNDMSHENFGNISLILKAEAVDPYENYDNNVYSADAYSSRFPQVDYSLNYKELKNLADKMNTSVSMLEANDFAQGNDRTRIIDELKRNDNFIDYYIKEFDIKQDVVYKTSEYSSILFLYDDIKEFLNQGYSFKDVYNNDSVQNKLLQLVERAKSKQVCEYKKNIIQSSYDSYIEKLKVARDDKYIYELLEKQYNTDKLIAQNKAEMIEDKSKTRDNTIDKLKNDKKYNEFVESVVDKVLDKKYLRNNKNYYSNSGIPRSFETLHEEYNAENAVRLMKEQGSKNSEGGNLFGYGLGEIRAALSRRYNNIAELHQDEARLQKQTEESEKLYEQCNDELHKIAGELSTRIRIGNFLEEREIALSAIFDIISKTKTNEQAKRIIKKDYTFEIKDIEIKKIRDLAEKVEKLPVNYFEAKPERVVNFNEIVEIVAPVGTNSKIIDFFNKKGIKVELYDENTSNRSEIIKNLPDNVRFALQSDEDNRAVGGLTRAQRAKFVANNTKFKVYSKTDATEVVNSIISERLVFDDKYGSLSGKSKTEVINKLFTKLNNASEGYRTGVALNIADYIIENTVLEDMYNDMNDTSEDMRVLSVLRHYLHNVNLKSIQGEIRHKYDRKNNINLIWGNNKSTNYPDTLAQELAEYGIFIDAINEADIFFQMVDIYENARNSINSKVEKVKLKTYGSEAKIEQLRQDIARDILLAYDEKGTPSKYAKLVEKYNNKIINLKQQVKEVYQRNILINNILDKVQKLKELKLGTFLNATQYKNDTFKNSVESLAKIKNRGNLNASGTRRIISELRQWYNQENPILEDNYNEEVAFMLDSLSGGGTQYSNTELTMLRDVVSYFTNFVNNFNKIYKQGKWVEAIPEAERYVKIMQDNEKVSVGLFGKLAGSSYMQTFGDPMTVARRMDRYDNGFYTEMMTELRNATIEAEIAEMEVKSAYNDFIKNNKKYLREISKTTVNYHGVEIPKAQIISLYMTMRREQAQAGLVQSGFAFINPEGKRVRVSPFAPEAYSEAEILTSIADERAIIEKSLTQTDKEYIAILETGFNQDAKKLKSDRDMQRLGYTNATEDYYYPIRRGNIAKNIDTSDIASELDRVSNASFNKDTVKGAKQELFIESADAVYNRHIKAVIKYAYLSPAIETYNRVFNLDISGNRNKPISVATESANTWAKGNKYFSKLISDIQGIPSSSSEGMKALRFLRGSYAKYQLGANPKVWVTQLSSIFASSSILDTDSILRGFAVSAKDVDTYCPLAKLRNSDNTAAMAQGVLDKVGKFSNVLMAPIGKMDRFVIKRLYGACQVQVQKNNGAKIGTVANKTEAGKLLQQIILETQQNSIATERSAAMRSGNEILRTVTMFSADSMKVIGRVIDSVGELNTLRARLKLTTDATIRTKLLTQIKSARRKVRKSIIALITSAAFMAGVAKLFRWLYDKEDEKENSAEVLAVDFVGNLFGGLPLLRDIYSRLAEGYDVDNYAYSALNDLLDSAANIIDLSEKLISGDASQQDIAKSLRKMAYAAGQVLGIPTRNVYNVTYGLTKRISPTTAYKIDNAFYNKNYLNDLKDAIETDDTDMINLLMNLVLDERIGGEYSDIVLNSLKTLYSSGYSVLPKSVGTSVTYNGESIELTDAEQKQFKNIYNKANTYIEKMILSQEYKKLPDEQKAKAIKQIYDAYYSKALSEILSVENTNKIALLSKYISIDKLSVVYSGISELTSDKNSNGETITGSKKINTIKYLLKQNLTDEQRLFILAYQGYSIKDNEYKGYTQKQAQIRLLRFILNLKATTQAEKAELAERCGFEVKNGRIITQTLYK